MNDFRKFSNELMPQWLKVLRDHRYDVDKIADPATRRAVLEALRRNGIEALRGSRGHIYATGR
jgi:hypothetical protein